MTFFRRNETIILLMLLVIAIIPLAQSTISLYPEKIVRGYHFTNNLEDVLNNDDLSALAGSDHYDIDKNNISTQALYINTTSGDQIATDNHYPTNQSGESYSFWIKTESSGISLGAGWIRHGGSINWNQLNWYCDDERCWAGKDSNDINDAGGQRYGTINDTEWHHFVITFTNDTLTIYQDNSLRGTTNLTENREDDKYYPLQIGGTTYQNNAYTIDELTQFNKTLNNTEINELYNAYGNWDEEETVDLAITDIIPIQAIPDVPMIKDKEGYVVVNVSNYGSVAANASVRVWFEGQELELIEDLNNTYFAFQSYNNKTVNSSTSELFVFNFTPSIDGNNLTINASVEVVS